MSIEQFLLIMVVLIPMMFVMLNKLRMDIASLIIAALLGTLQFIGFPILSADGSSQDAVKAISGFGQPVVITLICLFVITRSLEKSGITHWIARKLVKIGGKSERKLIALFSTTTALLSLFMNSLAAGALLLPSAIEVSRRTGVKPSKLLIPIAFGSLLGGTATYFTSANIIVSDMLRIAHPPQTPLNILDFTPTGGIIALAGIIYLIIFGPRLLPDRSPASDIMLTHLTGTELEEYYQLDERLFELCVQPGSKLNGKTLSQSGIGQDLGITVAAIWRGKQAIFSPSPDYLIQAKDRLLLVGREDRVRKMKDKGVTLERDVNNEHISTHGIRMVETILSPHSRSIGKTLKEINFRREFGISVVALHRMKTNYRTNIGDIKLEPGDSLLAIGSHKRIINLRKHPDFIVLEPNLSDQPINRPQAIFTSCIIISAIILSAFDFPVYLAMMIGALLIILFTSITMEEAYHAIEWQAIFLIAGMYSVSMAMVETNLASQIGTIMVDLVKPLGPLGLSAGAYLFSSLLTQIMGGQVTALVTGPIAISAAIDMGVNTHATAVATAIGCSASFFTPMAHPINILMLSSANYNFSDFFRIGWRLTLLSFIMLLLGMILFWSL